MTVADRFKGALFLPVGIALLVAAILVAESTQGFLARSRLAAGLVVAEPYGPHHVRVRFRTDAGRVVTYGQNGEITLHRGETVMVRYDPSDPTRDPCVDRLGAIWGTTVFLGAMGGILAIVGASLLRPARGAGIGA